MPTGRRPPRLLRLRVLAWRARHVVPLAALVVAAHLVVRTLAPPAVPTTPVVVAAQDLAVGEPLRASHLRVVPFPRDLVPPGATSAPAPLTDRSVVVGLPEGTPVVASVLAGERFSLEAPDGTVVVPVRLSDAVVAGLLRPGDRVDLVAPADTWAGDVDPAAQDPAGVDVLAHGALVLDVGPPPSDGGPGPLGTLGGSGGTGDAVTVVAVSPEQGQHLAARASAGPLGAVLVG